MTWIFVFSLIPSTCLRGESDLGQVLLGVEILPLCLFLCLLHSRITQEQETNIASSIIPGNRPINIAVVAAPPECPMTISCWGL